ncbi:hypothetical protein WR25_20271 [Diploscapter pachys]|uniref:non-specific serine/threonine protein kinase n=1 Tax=Diploscapter pachys TaxID=2018661 RepID=A0A2A2LP51_9BILA|nr:hypothetical protein WR25_20271 [Diploscapter pachys]
MSIEAPILSLEKGQKLGKWKILKKLDEGGFGSVFKVESLDGKKVAALKIESNAAEGGSAIKLEMQVLNLVTDNGKTPTPHVPLISHAAKRTKFCYLVMTLLGDNLKYLKQVRRSTRKNERTTKPQACKNERMTEKTWSRVGVQCLYGLKLVHDKGFVHRDIKPNNFVLGHRDDAERARIVHVLDFGLSRQYAYMNKTTGEFTARKARGTAEFRGTLRYVSPNVHFKLEQGRQDDLWSLFYVLIELHCGLPWQTDRDKSMVEEKKCHMSDKDVCLNFPAEMHCVLPHLRECNVYTRPDYSFSLYYGALLKVMKRTGTKPTDPYDWETPEDVKKVLAKNSKPAAWEEANEFFNSDPVKINEAPTRKTADKNQSKLIASNKDKKHLSLKTEHTVEEKLKKKKTSSSDVDVQT